MKVGRIYGGTTLRHSLIVQGMEKAGETGREAAQAEEQVRRAAAPRK